jgi:GNAT superfamily N-acetyltransferase
VNAQLQPRKLVIEREYCSDALFDEVKPLLYEQWREIANYQDEIPLDVDYDFYRRMESQKKLVWLNARLDGELVGYSVFILIRHPHYQSTVFAMNDVIFVREAHRKSWIGLGLIRQSERTLKALGARKISWHVKTTNDLSRILTLMGYATDEINMGKLL